MRFLNALFRTTTSIPLDIVQKKCSSYCTEKQTRTTALAERAENIYRRKYIKKTYTHFLFSNFIYFFTPTIFPNYESFQKNLNSNHKKLCRSKVIKIL